MIFTNFKYFRQQIVLLICCFSFLGYSQAQKLSDHAQVSILTCGSGDEMYSIFGHTAIRFTDQVNGLDVVYNYGMFDFSTPNFYTKFINGNLLYNIGIENYNEFLATYKYYNRSINEQYLNLTLDQKQKIFDKIQHQLTTNERYYQYKFIDNNCTTKVVDLLNDVLVNPIAIDFEGNNVSKRKILNSYLNHNYFEKLGINLLFSKTVDDLNNKVFLPENLMKSIFISKNGNRELLQNDVIHYEKKENSNKTNWNSIYFFSIICLILVFMSKLRLMQFILFFLFGVLGSVILVVSLFTNHSELIWNESLLLFNPLFFLLIIKKIKKVVLYLLLFFIVLFLLISSLEKIVIVLPLTIVEIVYLYQILKNNSK